ncbi:MAG: PIG-L family deacetylase [Gammaproteobacteria bacterium]|nr:PIG-L family deacetylase [Gammaproteobacteria bacterium]
MMNAAVTTTCFGRRILVLVPHPDDEVVGVCAAIGRAIRDGATVDLAVLSNGVPAREILWPWQRRHHQTLVARRWRECEHVSTAMRTRIALRQDIPTRTLRLHLHSTRAALDELIERLAPDRLWAPAYEGAHQDHDSAAWLASTFVDRLPVFEFAEYSFAGGRRWSNAFFDADRHRAQELLDLSAAEAADKRRLLACYASERKNLHMARLHQEVLRVQPAHDFSRPPHPGKTWYQRFQWVPRHPRVDYTLPEQVCEAIAAVERQTDYQHDDPPDRRRVTDPR